MLICNISIDIAIKWLDAAHASLVCVQSVNIKHLMQKLDANCVCNQNIECKTSILCYN